MADLNQLKEAGEELVPVIKNIISLVGKDKKPGADDKAPAKAAITKLKKVVSKANVRTSAGLAERSNAIHASRQAVITLLLEAASNPAVGLPRTKIRTLESQATSLRDAHGRLLEMAVFDDIARLLTDNQIDTIGEQLAGAQQEIAAKETAKEVLDITVQAVIVAAKIASKLA